MSATHALTLDLDALERVGRRRALAPRAGLDFSSNDYLGLAACEALRRAAIDAIGRGVPTGSGGSRLLRGNHEEHELLEQEAAAFFGAQSALFTSSGYSANSMLFATLPQTGDLILHDALVHASAREGMRLSRASATGFAHNNVDAAADAIAAWRRGGGKGTPWIAIESLYSMDGDRAPLADFVALAARTDAMLLIDEAHATGVFGPGDRELAAEPEGDERVIALRTCGKAMGAEGALIMCSSVIRDFLVNRGRGFIFSTAPSPLMAAIARASLRLLRDEPERRERLHALVAHAGSALQQLGIAPSRSPIQPVVIGDDRRTMAAAGALQAKGFDVRGIRPPTVPQGTSRLRISLTLNVGPGDVDALADAMEGIL